ncbi:hypothetical protein [Homoserinibacter sp. YIM 151385]|uniref:hypothetical protein n=1 Tax=Homoserinibacter sp. YIM 151385 TaxID=2985506 RepID=UPI0022F0FD5A|nr:hypothetical protein [Homoserinibacter sp. YIM 151385]WBU38779.1 hypothetical protein OF852_04140 [Homoserinibacter sp. YIM 151385]
MSTRLSVDTRPTQHPPHAASARTAPHAPRTVPLLDRIALHLGLALIAYGRRTLRDHPSRERRIRRHEQLVLREARERHAAREWLLIAPPR